MSQKPISSLGIEDAFKWHLDADHAISIEEFGASPTASAAANRAAIQSAINACPQFGRVVIPGKSYNIDAALTIATSFVTLCGEGTAYLNLTGTGNIIEVTAANCLLENLYLTTNAANAGNGLYINNAHDLRLNRVYIAGAQYHACKMENTWNVLTTDCLFRAEGSAAGYAGFYHGTQSNAVTHIRSYFFGGANIGADVVSGSAVGFRGCTIEGHAGAIGIRTGNANSITIDGCYFEGNGLCDIQIGEGSNRTVGARIQNNYFYNTRAGEVCVLVTACLQCKIDNNFFFGSAPAGSVGISVDGTTALAANVEIDTSNIFGGTAVAIDDPAKRALNWNETTLFTQRVIATLSEKPKDGSVWSQGSIVFNNGATTYGNIIGWINTRTGAAVKEVWTTGHTYTAGDFVGAANGHIYCATNSAVAGASTPTHTSGTASDGGVIWRWVLNNNGYGALAEFMPFGQLSMPQGGGSPVGVLTPNFAGETYVDYNVPDIYMSFGTGITQWKKIT
jgi:hypothetical protein